MALSFSVARFTYAPDESCPTADAAIATRSPIDWICYNPQATLSLVIDQTPGRSLMKCIDGEYIYKTWDLAEMQSEAEKSPGLPVVIVKFPNIVFRWYNHREKILHRIQFKLTHQQEFTTLTDLCIKLFGSVRDLHGKSGTSSSIMTTTGAIGINSSPIPPISSPSQGPYSSQPTWIPSSSQIQRLSQQLPVPEEPTKEKQPAPASKGKGAQRKSAEKSGERALKKLRKEQSEWDGLMNEEMMWGLLEDDTFVAEVERLGELWKKMGLNDRIFAHER